MIYGSIVEKTLSSLKHRLEKGQGTFEIYVGEGKMSQVNCIFNKPASIEEIIEFENSMDVVIPKDYKEFLLISNGCRLFDHPYYGGESYLFSLNEIKDFTFEDRYDGCYKIAYIYGENIVVNSSKYSSNEPNYLYVKSKIESFEESEPLHLNFELWLERFVISQGASFWNWAYQTAENYYKNR